MVTKCPPEVVEGYRNHLLGFPSNVSPYTIHDRKVACLSAPPSWNTGDTLGTNFTELAIWLWTYEFFPSWCEGHMFTYVPSRMKGYMFAHVLYWSEGHIFSHFPSWCEGCGVGERWPSWALEPFWGTQQGSRLDQFEPLLWMEDTPGQWPDCLEAAAGNSEGGDWPQAPPVAASGRPPGLSMVPGGSGQRPELLSLWWGRGGAGGTGFALTLGPALPPPPEVSLGGTT